MRTRLVALTVAILVSLAVVAPASAGKPLAETFREEGTAPLVDCGSFEILDRYVLNWTEKLFLDKDGTPIRLGEQVWGTDTFVNSVTGKEVTTKFHNTVQVDLNTGIGTSTGIIFRLTVPGAGAVFLDVGRIVGTRSDPTALFSAGPHQFFDGDIEALCAALA